MMTEKKEPKKRPSFFFDEKVIKVDVAGYVPTRKTWFMFICSLSTVICTGGFNLLQNLPIVHEYLGLFPFPGFGGFLLAKENCQ